MRKVLFVAFGLVALFISPYAAAGFSHVAMAQTLETIPNFEVDITIKKNSQVRVAETITYDFGENERHGIFRTIPVRYERNGADRSIRISDITVTDKQGAAIRTAVSYSGDNVEIRIGDPDVTVTGAHTYVINYTVARAINFFEQHDELYWNVTGNSWQVPIGAAKAEVRLEPQADNITTECFFGIPGSTEKCSQSVLGLGTVQFTAPRSLHIGEGLTIVFGVSKGVLAEPSRLDTILYFVADNGVLAIPVAVFLVMWFVWKKYGRDPKGRGTVAPEYEPPKDLTPIEIGVLVDNAVHSRDIAAELVYLAEHGFIRIEKVEKKKLLIFPGTDFKLVSLRPRETAKNDFDKSLLNMLFDGREEVHLSELKKDHGAFQDLAAAKDKVYKGLVAKGYFVRNPVTTKFVWVFAALAFGFGISFFGIWLTHRPIGFAAGIASGLIILIFGIFMPARTFNGSVAREQALGLKKYIELAEKDRLAFHHNPSHIPSTQAEPDRTPQRFEALLPFAMALGVDKAWAKIFEGVGNMQPSWYADQTGSFSAVALANSLGNFSSSVNSVTVSSAGGGGSGFSGGGSGGGFGGGGGGSW